jgi:hypothetical protein
MLVEKEKVMSHPDPLFDPDNSNDEDFDIYMDNDTNYDDYNDFYDEDNSGEIDWYDEGDDSMDGDHESALASAGWGTDEDYGYYGEDVDYREDFHSDDGYGDYGEDY